MANKQPKDNIGVGKGKRRPKGALNKTTLYERIEALTEAIREMEEERKTPLEFERDDTGRTVRVGAREVVRGPDGRVLRLQ